MFSAAKDDQLVDSRLISEVNPSALGPSDSGLPAYDKLSQGTVHFVHIPRGRIPLVPAVI